MMTDYEKQCFEAYIRLMDNRKSSNKNYYEKMAKRPDVIAKRNDRNKTYYERNKEKILAQQKVYRSRRNNTQA
jgi:hypothetical protein